MRHLVAWLVLGLLAVTVHGQGGDGDDVGQGDDQEGDDQHQGDDDDEGQGDDQEGDDQEGDDQQQGDDDDEGKTTIRKVMTRKVMTNSKVMTMMRARRRSGR